MPLSEDDKRRIEREHEEEKYRKKLEAKDKLPTGEDINGLSVIGNILTIFAILLVLYTFMQCKG